VRGEWRVMVRRGSGYAKKCFIFSHILKIVKIEILSLSCLSVCPSVRPSVHPSVRLSAWKNWVPTKQFLIKFDISEFFENLSRELKFH